MANDKKGKKDSKPAYKQLIPIPLKYVRIWSAIFVPIMIWQMSNNTRPRKYIEAEWAKFTAPFRSISSPAAPVSPARQAEAAPSKQVIRVEVDPEKWSKEIEVPRGSHLGFSHPGCWFQLRYSDGSKSEIRKDDGLEKEPIMLRSCKFQLRGNKGTMEISIESR